MSALGHKRTCAVQERMSALPPKADIDWRLLHVRFVPEGRGAAMLRLHPHKRRARNRCGAATQAPRPAPGRFALAGVTKARRRSGSTPPGASSPSGRGWSPSTALTTTLRAVSAQQFLITELDSEQFQNGTIETVGSSSPPKSKQKSGGNSESEATVAIGGIFARRRQSFDQRMMRRKVANRIRCIRQNPDRAVRTICKAPASNLCREKPRKPASRARCRRANAHSHSRTQDPE
jgi:hypothetical protein